MLGQVLVYTRLARCFLTLVCFTITFSFATLRLHTILVGISPFLSEAEVFDNPSRTARLVLAVIAFVRWAWIKMW
jgi:hypothetical protein